MNADVIEILSYGATGIARADHFDYVSASATRVIYFAESKRANSCRISAGVVRPFSGSSQVHESRGCAPAPE